MPQPPEIDALLAEDRWIRRMARSLVADSHLADDLAQDTWLAALKRPAAARAVRPWIGGILRNLRRSHGRRQARREEQERRAARPDTSPSAGELVEEVTLRREVADLLLELEEPYRTVLYLRFFRDLSLKKIAARTGVPVSTAHARLLRGLEEMRQRLDRAHGGDRRSWASAMLPLASSAGGLAAAPLSSAVVGVAMSTGAKLAASLVVLAAAFGLWVELRGSRSVTPQAAASAPGSRPADSAAARLKLAEDSGAREQVEGPPVGPASSASGTDAHASRRFRGRVIDGAQHPVPGVAIGISAEGRSAVVGDAVADAEGRFELELPLPDYAEALTFDAWMERFNAEMLLVRDRHLALLAVGLIGTSEVIVIVGPKADIAGTVVDEAGAPLAGTQVAVRVRQDLYRALGLSHVMSSENGRWSVRTDSAGRFQVSGACGGEAVFLDVHRSGFKERELELPAQGSRELVIELERLDDATLVTGRVLDAGGAPVEGALVSMGHAIERTDAEGRFAILWSPNEAYAQAPFFMVEDGLWDSELGPLHIAAVKPGLQPVQRELETGDLAQPLVLQLGAAPLAIAGRVVDDAGLPLGGVAVWEANPHRFGTRSQRQGEEIAWETTTLEEELRGGQRGALTDGEGRFELGGLMPGTYELRVLDPASGAAGESRSVQAGAHEIELVLPLDPSLARVAGRVVSAGGAPLAHVRISPLRAPPPGPFQAYELLPVRLQQSVLTDEQGRFALPRVATAEATLQLSHERTFFSSVSLANVEDLEHLELVEPLLCELQVVSVDAGDGATHAKALDGTGRQLWFVEAHWQSTSQMLQAQIRAGRSGVLRLPETAKTLVLYAGERELSRLPLALDPDRRTLIQP